MSLFFVAGITGNVGGAAAERLLAAGHQVRSLVRTVEKAAHWAARGVELRQGDWNSTESLAQALEGVAGAYLMMPPTMTPSPDFREAKAVLSSYAEALQRVPVPRLVMLSSIGSEKESGLGLITSTSLMERALRDVPFPVAFVRAGSFYENSAAGVETAKQTGMLYVFHTPTDRAVPMVATKDIGAEVAKLLTGDWSGRKIVELGSLVTPAALAAEMGAAVGREVKAVAVPRERWAATFEQFGMPAGSTGPYEEMLDGVNSGWIGFTGEGERVEGTTAAREVFAAA